MDPKRWEWPVFKQPCPKVVLPTRASQVTVSAPLRSTRLSGGASKMAEHLLRDCWTHVALGRLFRTHHAATPHQKVCSIFLKSCIFWKMISPYSFVAKYVSSWGLCWCGGLPRATHSKGP